MKARFLILLLGLAAGSLMACGDPLRTKATLVNIDDTSAVYAFTGAPESGPTAVNIFVPTVVRVDPTLHPDVIFDIRNDSAFLLPPSMVGVFGTAGFQLTATPYDQVTEAPVNGYNDSTATYVKPGDVVLIQSLSYGCSTQVLAARQFIYAKMVVDSIFYDTPPNPATQVPRTMYFRLRTDPNCGFISFADGIPTF